MAILKQSSPPESEVKAIQLALKSKGYDLGSYGENKDGVDGKLGKKTINALKDFSKSNPVIAEKYSKITGYKPEGSENKPAGIRGLQKALVDKGYDLGSYGKNKDGIDGKMGKKTIAALKDYAQKDAKFASEYKDILPKDFKPQIPTIQRPKGVGVMHTAKQDATQTVIPQGRTTRITDPLIAAARFLPKQEAPRRPVLSESAPEPEKKNSLARGITGLRRDFAHKYLGVPLAVNQLIHDVSGQEAPITEKSLTKKELEALKKIVRSNMAKGKNIIEYADYGTQDQEISKSKSQYNDVSGSAANSEIIGKMFDPNYNLKTTIGQSGYYTEGNDTIITDQYNFNNRVAQPNLKDFLADAKEVGPSIYSQFRNVGKHFGSKEGEGSPVKIRFKGGGKMRILKTKQDG